MGKTQMIAVDGSEQAENAFKYYLENFHKEGDNVLMVHCAEYNVNFNLFLGNDQAVNEICAAVAQRKDEIEKLQESFMLKLREKKIDAKWEVLPGEKPGESIVNKAKEAGVDHIIMGTRGLGKIRRTILGSVSEYVIHHAHCPVSIIRKPQEL